MPNKIHISFRNKLLLLLLTISVVPLLLVAYIVSSTVQDRYRETLAKSFETNVEYREKILNYYLEGNKEWIRSIAAQDIFLAEMEKYNAGETYSENKIFASLVSLRRENQFIDKIYIADIDGKIISSTTTDDNEKIIENFSEFKHITQRGSYYQKIKTTPQGKRIVTLTTPFIKRNDGEIIGLLIAEYNASVVKSLIDGSLYESRSINQESTSSLGNTFIIDEDGYILTSITGTNIQKTPKTQPIQLCQLGSNAASGYWINKEGKEVYGSYKCNQIDNMKFTYIVEEESSKAFTISDNVRNTIFMVTLTVAVLLIIATITTAGSVTRPVKKLAHGAQEFGKGNFTYALDVKTGDELEELADSFSEMAKQINGSINSLKQQEDKLNKINQELETEKETISAERNKLEVIIAGITDAVIALDMNRKIVTSNKAAQELIGLSADEMLGKNIADLIKLEDESGEVVPDTYSPIRKDDFEGVIYKNDELELKPFRAKTTKVKLITGKIKEAVSVNLGCILTIHDKSKEAELEEMKLDFVSMAAHELRTPITSIRGYAGLLGEEVEEFNDPRTNDWKTLISRISVSAEQLLALVENLLNVTKIEKGILSITCKNENWKECVQEVSEVFKERAISKEIKLTVKETDEAITAYVDKLRINEVLSNLISNAINYTQNGGNVTVEAHLSADGNWIETSVADNGKGIPKSAQGHLFEKFFRVAGPLEQGSKGNGLGLYISKSIVEMHGGKIWVESDEGKGAKFTYTIQRATT